MIDKPTKAFNLAVSVFAVSTTIGQVLAIEKWELKLLIGTPNLIAWGYVFYCSKRYRHFNPTKRHITKVKDILKSSDKIKQIRYRHIRNKEELHQIWEMDTLAYGEDNFDFEQFVSWWTRYPYSPFALFEGTTILGSCGIWPLTPRVFDRIKEGAIREEMITEIDLVCPERVHECTYWYFAGMPMRTERDIFHEYLAESLNDWLSRLGEHQIIQCVALRYTRSDEELLSALGFYQYKTPSTRRMLPVFYRTFDGREEILDYIKALRGYNIKSGTA